MSSMNTSALPASGPAARFSVVAADGRTVCLCDFASAGAAGNPDRSWLPMMHLGRASVRAAHGPFGDDDAALRPTAPRE
jgi:hypothetical protein